MFICKTRLRYSRERAHQTLLHYILPGLRLDFFLRTQNSSWGLELQGLEAAGGVEDRRHVQRLVRSETSGAPTLGSEQGILGEVEAMNDSQAMFLARSN